MFSMSHKHKMPYFQNEDKEAMILAGMVLFSFFFCNYYMLLDIMDLISIVFRCK